MYIPWVVPVDIIRSILSIRPCMDFRSEFSDETLFLTLDILAACCIMNGKGASSSNWSSSAQKTQSSGYQVVELEYLEIMTS